MLVSDGGTEWGRGSAADTRQEILAAARAFLWECPFRELTVARLMEPTSVGRSAFYVHFRDLYGLAAALLETVDSEVEKASRPFRESFPGQMRPSAESVVAVWVRHGPVLRAIVDASAQDARLDHLYRYGFVQAMINRIEAAIFAAQRADRVDSTLDAAEVATLLILMNERYLDDRFGRSPQGDPKLASDVLVLAWERVLRT